MTGKEQTRASSRSTLERESRQQAPPHDEVSLLTLMNVILRRRRIAIGVPLILVAVAVALSLALPRERYAATSRFILQTSDSSPSQLARLAAQFGAVIDLGSGGESPAFYIELLQSRELLRDAVESRYRFPTGPERRDTLEGTLVELYGIEAESSASGVRQAMGRLLEGLKVETGAASGLITLETTAPWPGLAVRINRRLIELVNEFNTQRRQSQAKAERIFIEERMAQARQELDSAVAGLREFLERNRRFESSPELQLEKTMLERVVEHRQALYTALASSYDQARIAEVRDMPTITLLEPPEGSARRARPSVLLHAVIALILGGVIGIVVSFAQEHFERQRAVNPVEYDEFNTLVRATVKDLRADRLLHVVRSRKQRAEPEQAPASSPSREAGGEAT